MFSALSTWLQLLLHKVNIEFLFFLNNTFLPSAVGMRRLEVFRLHPVCLSDYNTEISLHSDVQSWFYINVQHSN